MIAAPPVPPEKPDLGLRPQPCAFLASDPCHGPYIPSHWMVPHGLACQVAGQTCLRVSLFFLGTRQPHAAQSPSTCGITIGMVRVSNWCASSALCAWGPADEHAPPFSFTCI